jgi:hypothetical protein
LPSFGSMKPARGKCTPIFGMYFSGHMALCAKMTAKQSTGLFCPLLVV